MAIEYYDASDIKRLVEDIIENLDFFHVTSQYVYCVRSRGSLSKNVIARIHGLGRIWQETLHLPPSYIVEVISEKFDRLTIMDKEKTIIHELLHIPSKFSGGFRPHRGYVDQATVDKLYKKLKRKRELIPRT